MKVQKLFSSNTKPILQKPPYVKPKHRTYRELLALDRQKKKVQVQSDDQNDDFLNKILKQEDKKQKTNKSNKNQAKKSKPTSPKKLQGKKETNVNNVKDSKENINNENIKAKINLTELVKKQKENQKQQKDAINLIKNKKQINKKLQKQETSVDAKDGIEIGFQPNIQLVEKESPSLNVNYIQNASSFDKTKIKFKYSQNFRKSASQKDKIKDDIYIDQTSTQKYRFLQQENKVIKNNFFSKLKIKNMQGTTLLRARTHAHLIKDPAQSNALITKIQETNQNVNGIEILNPQAKSKQIQHHILKNQFSSIQIKATQNDHYLSASQNYRNVVLKLAMMQINRMEKPLHQKKKTINSQRLFKNQYQEKLFLKSLQTVK